ncbi:hypothetical protein MesoLjLc_12840 [Mesorhizobium sp. L-8-10]|uniref:TRAP transporter small permease n=1 Tax=Mesorhizobium sp. L-8-10 TaxID=2744523 RepID=UPI001925E33D|nr:TRAP transporter small permease [Mesorhizobium sp. L-8-10]BCH29354.1 hypothetical protein MesoLjLc_12840 [Mesorhizobium sp. L-8-10]
MTPSSRQHDTVTRAASRLGGRPSRLLAGAGGIMLFAMMLLTLLDVAGRYLFDSPLPATSELVAYMMAGLVFGTLPYVSYTERNVTIDLLDETVPARLKRSQGIFVNLFSTAALGFITWRLADKAAFDLAYPETTPELSMSIWPFTVLMALLCAFATVTQFCAALLYITGERQSPSDTTSDITSQDI